MKTLELINTKFVTIDYIGEMTSHTKFGANLSTGGLLGIYVNITNTLFIRFSLNATTGQTARLFTRCGLKDADSGEEVLFGGLGDT